MTPPRRRWAPILLDRFGVRPWEMDDFTPDELAQLHAALEAERGE